MGLVPFTADELLQMDEDELRSFRGGIFRHHDPKLLAKMGRPLIDFCVMLSMVQDMRAWSKLAEPGIAAWLDDDVSEEDIEDARFIDRNSIDMHNEVLVRFEEAGGKEGFQKVIDAVNAVPEPPVRIREWDDIV